MPKFCHNCGKEAQPLWKACPYCETSFSSLTNRPPIAPPPAKQQESITTPFAFVDRDDEGGDSYIDKAQSLSDILRGKRLHALDVEIRKDQPIKETIGSVHSQATKDTPDVVVRPTPYAGIDSEAFLKEFQKEAGTRGPSHPNS